MWYRRNANKSSFRFREGTQGMQENQCHGLATRLLYGTQGTIGRKREEEKLTKNIVLFLPIFHLWRICKI